LLELPPEYEELLEPEELLRAGAEYCTDDDLEGE
jgi:hypothetical protein